MRSDWTYDAVGNVKSETRGNGQLINHVYDNFNRKLSSTDQLGLIASQTYDPNGNVATETGANNRTNSHTYNQLNPRVSSGLPEKRTLSITYSS